MFGLLKTHILSRKYGRYFLYFRKILTGPWTICRSAGIRHVLEIFLVTTLSLQILLFIYWNPWSNVIDKLSSKLKIEPSMFSTPVGRYDNSRCYLIQDSIYTGDHWPDKISNLMCHTFINNQSSSPNKSIDDVCLATQTSIDKLHHIFEVGLNWQGLISLAIFIPYIHHHQMTIRYIEYISKCHSDIAQNLSIHFVFPGDCAPIASGGQTKKDYVQDLEMTRLSCDQWKKRLIETSMNMTVTPYLYPQNLLRNTARKNCAADYVLLTDVDIIPVFGLADKLREFLRLENEVDSHATNGRGDDRNRVAYVVPAYEMKSDENQKMPMNKSQLLDMIRMNKARSYRSKAFKHNQGATNSSAWEMHNIQHPDDPTIKIAYKVPNFNFYYEPFYIALDDVPPHDERFIGYGYTRNTQIYEMRLAGYNFFVLDNVFLIHRGMADHPAVNENGKRRKQVMTSHLKLARFMDEIEIRYKKPKVSSQF